MINSSRVMRNLRLAVSATKTSEELRHIIAHNCSNELGANICIYEKKRTRAADSWAGGSPYLP